MGRSKSSDEVTVTVKNKPSRGNTISERPIYEGVTLNKRVHSRTGETVSWLNATESPMARSSIYKVVERNRTCRADDVSDQYYALRSDNQRRRIDMLLTDWRRKESERHYKWNLYWIMDERAYVSKRSTQTQTKALHVVLERSCRPIKLDPKVNEVEKFSQGSKSPKSGRSARFHPKAMYDYAGTDQGPRVVRYMLERPRALDSTAEKTIPLIEAPQAPDPTANFARRQDQPDKRYVGSFLDPKPTSELGLFPLRTRLELDDYNRGTATEVLYQTHPEYSRNSGWDFASPRSQYRTQEQCFADICERGSFDSSRYSDLVTLDNESVSLSSGGRTPSSSHRSLIAIDNRGPTRQYSHHSSVGPSDHPDKDYIFSPKPYSSSRTGMPRPDNPRQWSEKSFRTTTVGPEPALRQQRQQRRSESAIEIEETHPRRVHRPRFVTEPNPDNCLTQRFASLHTRPSKRHYRPAMREDLQLPPGPARSYSYNACQD